MLLKGKTAVVTGSTSGIGLAIAKAIAKAGGNVILNGFGDAEEIEKQRAQIAELHEVEVKYHPADMTKPDQIEDLIINLGESMGGIDIVVNNAGVQHVSPIESFPPEKWDLIIALNLSSAFHTTRFSFPQMKEKKWGRIVNIASAHGLVASPFKSAYVAAKHGIIGLTKTIALEGADFGITCNAICPGYVLTPLVEGQIDDTAKAKGIARENVVRDVLLAKHAIKQFVTVEQIAEWVLFLCGPSASSVTGTALPVDGGWTAH